MNTTITFAIALKVTCHDLLSGNEVGPLFSSLLELIMLLPWFCMLTIIISMAIFSFKYYCTLYVGLQQLKYPISTLYGSRQYKVVKGKMKIILSRILKRFIEQH